MKVTITNNQELFGRVREIAAVLYDGGANEAANALLNALSISSVPGEILGEIRLALEHVRRSPLYEQENVRWRVEEGIAYVGRVLGT